MGGCRWATPHLEVGESDQTVIVAEIDQKLHSAALQYGPKLATAPTEYRWTAIMGFSCDGLPLVGPLPGRNDMLACCGFHEQTTTMGLRSAELIVQGLLEGSQPRIPTRFQPMRFL